MTKLLELCLAGHLPLKNRNVNYFGLSKVLETLRKHLSKRNRFSETGPAVISVPVHQFLYRGLMWLPQSPNNKEDEHLSHSSVKSYFVFLKKGFLKKSIISGAIFKRAALTLESRDLVSSGQIMHHFKL